MEKRKNVRVLSLGGKFILALTLLTCLLGIALGVVISGSYRSQMEQYYAQSAFNYANIAAAQIDGDTISRYAKTLEPDDYYEEISDFLLNIKRTAALQYFYVVVPREKDMFYIWDVGEEGDEGICRLGDRDNYYGGGRELMQGVFLDEHAAEHILITRDPLYGYLASAYVPIKDSTGRNVALASVDMSMDSINQVIRQFVFSISAVTCLLLILFLFLYYLFMRHTILKPLKILHQATSNMVKDNIEQLSDASLDIHTGDELEDLARSFHFMIKELQTYIVNLSQVTAEKERIGAELQVATQIQASMLPCIFPAFPHKPEFDIYATMQPAKEVGGDFYDFFLIDEDHLCIVIADVSGKGIPAALFMVITKTLIKNHAQAGEKPCEVFYNVNRQLCENNDANLFVTAWMAVYEMSSGHFTYVNAGHNPPLLRQDDSFEWLRAAPGFVLAGLEDITFTQAETTLNPGDMIYLYTDGVTEATDTLNNLYGDDRLMEELNRRGDLELAEILFGIKADIDCFAKGAPQFDDITMLALRIKNPLKQEET